MAVSQLLGFWNHVSDVVHQQKRPRSSDCMQVLFSGWYLRAVCFMPFSTLINWGFSKELSSVSSCFLKGWKKSWPDCDNCFKTRQYDGHTPGDSHYPLCIHTLVSLQQLQQQEFLIWTFIVPSIPPESLHDSFNHIVWYQFFKKWMKFRSGYKFVI